MTVHGITARFGRFAISFTAATVALVAAVWVVALWASGRKTQP